MCNSPLGKHFQTKYIYEMSLQIFGLKALVKSCLSVKDPNSNPRIDDVIGILMNILMFGEISREIESR